MLQNDQILGMWRTAAKSANAIANTLLSGTRRMFEKQAEISRDIVGEYADAAKEIEAATDMHGLLAVQGRLARIQMQKTATWWAALSVEAGVAQRELLRNAQASAQEFADSLSRMLDRVAPAQPVMSAMKLVVDATRSSYAASTEAGPTAATPTMPAEPRQRASGKGGRQASG